MILVGVLSTIENEYEECIASIQNQSYSEFDIFEIKNKPNKEAHDQLYSHFMNCCEDYWLFIKIDADMVIEDRHLFKKIVRAFTLNEKLDWLKIPVYDHFLNEHIYGVNVYRNCVKWKKNGELYYTDRVHMMHTIREHERWKIPDEKILIHHCPNPGDFQSFHFGYHRMMKAVQPGCFLALYKTIHWKAMKKLVNLYESDGSMKNLYALMGAECALVHGRNGESISYADHSTQSLFNEYKQRVNGTGCSVEDLCPELTASIKKHHRIGYTEKYITFRFKAVSEKVASLLLG